MKPIIIPRGKVLEVLFKGHEVLDITFSKNGKAQVSKLTNATVCTIRDIVENADDSRFFVALVESEEDIPADTPPEQPGESETPDKSEEVTP